VTVYLGMPIIYRPRTPYGRQHELFGFVTRVIDADAERVDIITFPSNSEVIHYDNCAKRGDKIQVHCWEPTKAVGAIDPAMVEPIVAALVKPLTQRLAALEKRVVKDAAAA